MKRLHWYDFLWINLFWLGLNIRNGSISSIVLPYLVAQFARPEIRNTALGEMRTAGLVIAMLVQPAMGLLSDRSTSRFGRRRPFIFAGVLLDLIFLTLVAFAWDYWSLLVFILLFQFSANVSHGPLQALIPDLVPQEQRGIASGVKGIMELLPLVLVAFTIARLVGAGQYRLAILAAGASLLMIMLLTVFFVKETPQRVKPTVALGPAMLRVLGILAGIGLGAAAGLAAGALIGGLAGLAAWPVAGTRLALAIGVGIGGLVAMVTAVVTGVRSGVRITLGRSTAGGVRQTAFAWWVVNRLMFLTAITSIQTFAPFFLMNALKIGAARAASLTGSLILVVGLFTLSTALPGGWLSDRFGQRRLVGLSGLLGALGAFLLLGTIFEPRMDLLYVAGSMLGMATGLFTATSWALGTRLVPPGEAGRYLGISNLAGAGAGMVGAGIGGPVADYLNGYLPGSGYFALFAIYGILFLLGTLALRGVRPDSQLALSAIEPAAPAVVEPAVSGPAIRFDN